MNPLGILVYGYNEQDVRFIVESLGHTLGQEIFVISASKKEDMKIRDILEKGPEDLFEDNETKIIMFLAFSKEQIDMTLTEFPDKKDLTRPIFCGLTNHNIGWQLSDLTEHLLEEERHWKKKT
ncbi:MAG: DUF3783 domain-containing protein [Thermodesulfobacteriota bacterium]|nr:DUF3783 domain-containing protein [Thermodesulfobacteriota bacterium]